MRFAIALFTLALVTAPAAASPAPQPAGVAAAPAADDETVSGVIVEGLRLPDRECHERDHACIVTVVAELKRRYPEQLKTFCFRRKMRDIAKGAPVFGADHAGSVALRLACAKDPPKEATP